MADKSTEAPQTKYHLVSHEGLSRGFQRILCEQLGAAVWQLSQASASSGGPPEAPEIDAPVHETRKALKRARSELRLLKPAFARVYRRENAALRQAGRRLSPARDADALIEVFDKSLAHGTLSSVREALVAHRAAATGELLRNGGLQRVRKTLEEVRSRIQHMPWSSVDRDALAKGLERTIRRGRKAYDAAASHPDLERLHELRKRAKDLRFHAELLQSHWKDAFDGCSQTAKSVEQDLGDDHNLGVLWSTVRKNPAEFGTRSAVARLGKLVQKHRRKLQRKALRDAKSLYAEKPKRWRRRLERARA